VIRRVFPPSLWGGESNLELVLKSTSSHIMPKISTYSTSPDVRLFIRARRFESMTLHQFLQGFSTSECDWLLPNSTKGKTQRPTAEESRKRRELLEEWLYYLVDGFLVSLLKVLMFAVFLYVA
jgi:hypothetical protein